LFWAGFGPSRHDGGRIASAGCATRSRCRRPVKGSGSSEIEKGVGHCPQVGNRLWTTGGRGALSGAPQDDRSCWGRPQPRFTDERHLGCSGSRSSSRKTGRSAPRTWMRPRKLRRARVRELLPSRDGVVVRSSTVLLASSARRRRSLQPAAQRSHDERCPSGSGRGSALFRRPARAAGSEIADGVSRRPLARETSAGDRRWFSTGCEASSASWSGATRVG